MESYWVITMLDDSLYRVTDKVAGVLRGTMMENSEGLVYFKDILDGDCWIEIKCVVGMYKTTPELRAAARAHQRMIDAEGATDSWR